MLFKKKRRIRTTSPESQIPPKAPVCPECGGTGETMNEDHYIADFYPEHRYVICKKCFGKGYMSQPDNNEY